MPKVVEVLTDLSGVAGAALVALGAWEVYQPAGYIAGGLLLLAGAMRLSRSS